MIKVKQKPLTTAAILERPVDALSQATNTFWRMHTAIRGRAVEDITMAQAIDATRELKRSVGPHRILYPRVQSLSGELIKGKPTKTKQPRSSVTILPIHNTQ